MDSTFHGCVMSTLLQTTESLAASVSSRFAQADKSRTCRLHAPRLRVPSRALTRWKRHVLLGASRVAGCVTCCWVRHVLLGASRVAGCVTCFVRLSHAVFTLDASPAGQWVFFFQTEGILRQVPVQVNGHSFTTDNNHSQWSLRSRLFHTGFVTRCCVSYQQMVLLRCLLRMTRMGTQRMTHAV